MRTSHEVVGFCGFAFVNSAGFVRSAIPSHSEIREHGHDPHFRHKMREAYLPSAALGLAVGAGLAYLVESWYPLAAAAIGTAGWVAVAESALPADVRWSPLQLFAPPSATPQLQLIQGGRS